MDKVLRADEYLCNEIVELDDVLAQLQKHYSGIGEIDLMKIASQLLLVKQIRFLRDDVREK